MTNKEAILVLKRIEDASDEWAGLNKYAKDAFDMAIEALNHSEIPNSSDCIDRAEAQTAIQFAARRYTVAHEAHGEGHVVWSDNLISVTDAMNALREVPSAQLESRRTFVELVVEYPEPELCTYKEYKGKPYYSIKYIENGETHIGYGTYNPKVLSQYLSEYFISSAQPEPKKGEWIVYKAPDKQHCGLVKCPFCSEELTAEPDEYHYCPNCGADMRGEQDGKTT